MIFSFFTYQRRRSQARKLFYHLYESYQNQYLKRSMHDDQLETCLDALAVEALQKKPVKGLTKSIAQTIKGRVKRGFFTYFKEVLSTLFFAAFILIVVRQVFFEHQKIPTGSMRPTFRELDHVFVRKSSFGINNPFSKNPISFDANLLERGDIVTFTSEGLPYEGTDMHYFGLIPGKKRFVKRLLAKPRDKVWFYGGKVWVWDSQKKQLVNSSGFAKKDREYIPFHHFFGKLEWVNQEDLQSSLFNKRLIVVKKSPWNLWKPLESLALQTKAMPWGIDNYGIARLIPLDKIHFSPVSSEGIKNYPYYLEISHHPTIFPTALTYRDNPSCFYVHRSLLPLSETHFKALKQALYTCRFEVNQGQAYKYHFEKFANTQSVALESNQPSFQPIPNGIYEFEEGKAYQIGSTGQRYLLAQEHPLYQEGLVCTLFNCGLSWHPKMQIQHTSAPLLPYRYVYFDQDNLKTMGQLLMHQDEPLLKQFIQSETKRHQLASFYPPFIDQGLPTEQLIDQEGLELNEKEVLLLGDNHADSGDSRDFGLVPVSNIQGSVAWRFWPLSALQESFDQRPIPLSRFDGLVWLVLGSLALLWQAYQRTKFSQALRKWQLYKIKNESI